MRLAVALAALLAAACASELRNPAGVDLLGASGVYTLVNLHPDERRSTLYAVNYQQSGLIPMCSEVRIRDLTRKRLTFRVLKRNRDYYYFYHQAAAEPFEEHLLRFFGRECNLEEVGSLSEIDQTGIHEGTVLPGMTKRGVTYALGYPPRHVNPDLDTRRWTYWKNRVDRMVVVFDKFGVVTEVRD
jgi:hypothetical protein